MRDKLNSSEVAYYKSCLRSPVSVQEIESRKIGRPSPLDSIWREFLEQMLETDELWQYSSSKEDWENLIGEAGVAIVRDGDVVDILTLLHN